MLEVRGLAARYGGIVALDGVDLAVREGEIVALLGANGAGKSTLLGCLTASAPCTASGSVRLGEVDVLAARTDALIRAGIVLVPEGRQLFGELTVRENLAMGAYLRPRGEDLAGDFARIHGLFPVLKEREHQLAQTLSGGEQQMVAIGRALMARPRLMLLDEPSLGLAPRLVTQMFKLIREINRQGVTLLVVEQNARQALAIADRAYVLEKGRVTLAGEAAALARDPHVVSAYLGGAAGRRPQHEENP